MFRTEDTCSHSSDVVIALNPYADGCTPFDGRDFAGVSVLEGTSPDEFRFTLACPIGDRPGLKKVLGYKVTENPNHPCWPKNKTPFDDRDFAGVSVLGGTSSDEFHNFLAGKLRDDLSSELAS